jgi:RND family efflux transporter MFP subunit
MRRHDVLAAAALLLTGCPGARQAAPPAVLPVDVVGATATRHDVAREVSLPAELWAWQRVAIVARVTGYVGKVPVDRGSVVKEGDLLATVTAPELDDQRRKCLADVKVAEADIASARANADLQTLTARRVTALVADRAVSMQEADEARARELVARAAAAQAEAKLAAARENLASTETWLSYTAVAAPFGGVVMDRWVHPGAFVSAAEKTPLFELVDGSTIRAVVCVPETDAPWIQVGLTPVRVSVPELPGGARPGTVSRSATALDPRTRTLRIEVDLANKAGDLLPGMFGQAALVLEVRKDAVTVPSTAVVRADGDPAVLVVQEGRLRRRTIHAGLDDGKLTEVTSGLEPGEVVAAQARGLSDGALVKLLEPAAKEGR